MAKAGTELDETTSAVVGNVESISKSGNTIEISSSRESKIDTGDGNSVTIGESVSFKVENSSDNPSISDINGIKADLGVKVKINSVQVVEGGVDVTASKFGFQHTTHIPLEDDL